MAEVITYQKGRKLLRVENDLNVPRPVLDALAGKEFEAAEEERRSVSVTELASPPLLVAQKRAATELHDRASDMVDRFIGAAIHDALAYSLVEAGYHVELPVFATVEAGSGQIDVRGRVDAFHPQRYHLVDIKTVKPFAATMIAEEGIKPEWLAQMDMYAWLLNEAGHTVFEAQIWMLLREYDARRAEREKSYPARFIELDVGLRGSEEVKDEVVKKIDTILSYEAAVHAGRAEDLPPCSDEDRWLRGEAYAVMKKGRKTAIKLYRVSEYADAAKTLAEKHAERLGGQHYVEHRPGEYVRCKNYCPVRNICPHNPYRETEV